MHPDDALASQTAPVFAVGLKNTNRAGEVALADIFISYRRSDSEYIAGRIREHLVRAFGPEHIFFDVDSIPLGTDFREVVRQALSECRACLVIIGPNWIERGGEIRRIDSESDYVRIEVETALELKIPVVPVLVGRAQMPAQAELPGALQSLVFRNGLAVRPDPDFEGDVRRLIRQLPPPKIPASTPLPNIAENQREEGLDPFIHPYADLQLGKTTSLEVAMLAEKGIEWARRSLMANRVDKFDIKYEGERLTAYELSSFRLSKGCRIEFDEWTVNSMLERLRGLGYTVKQSNTSRSREWYEFWDDTRVIWVHAKKTTADNQQVDIRALFLASGLSRLLTTPCLKTVHASLGG